MKKVLLMLGLVAYSFISISQQVVLNNVVSIKAPASLKKIDKSEKNNVLNRKFGQSDFAKILFKDSDVDAFLYNDGDILIKIIARTIPFTNEDKLLGRKNFYDRQMSKLPGYSSTILTINNNKVLIVRMSQQDVVNYMFCSFTPTSAITGSILSDKAGEDKAKKTLDEIVKSIKFI